MARESIGAEPSCAAAGQNSALFMAENTSQTRPPQLCGAQPALKSTVEWRGGALFSHKTHSLDHYQVHTATFVCYGLSGVRTVLPKTWASFLSLAPTPQPLIFLAANTSLTPFFSHWLFQSTQVPEWPASPPGLPRPWPMAQTC